MTDNALDSAVRAALRSVNDPHLPISLADLGMIAGVEADHGDVTVRLRIPCMACPGLGMLRAQIDDALRPLAAVRSVNVVEDWSEPWSRDLVASEAQVLMRAHGIQI